MRLGWSVGAGPFRLGGTIWRSKRRGKRRKTKRPEPFHGSLPQIGWTCQHNHSRADLAGDCARREARRRGFEVVN
jgi:hypothetical protein